MEADVDICVASAQSGRQSLSLSPQLYLSLCPHSINATTQNQKMFLYSLFFCNFRAVCVKDQILESAHLADNRR